MADAETTNVHTVEVVRRDDPVITDESALRLSSLVMTGDPRTSGLQPEELGRSHPRPLGVSS